MSEEYQDQIKRLAGRVIYKIVENGAHGAANVEIKWINEYTEVLQLMYPDMEGHVQELKKAVNTWQREGFRVQIDEGRLVTNHPEIFVISEV